MIGVGKGSRSYGTKIFCSLEGQEAISQAIRKAKDNISQREVIKLAVKVSGAVQEAMKQGAPSGRISDSISAWEYRLQARIGSKGQPHAVLFEYGADPHPIEAKKVMASPEQIFGKRVSHPGMQDHPFVRPAWDRTREQYLRDLADAVVDAIARGGLGQKTRVGAF